MTILLVNNPKGVCFSTITISIKIIRRSRRLPGQLINAVHSSGRTLVRNTEPVSQSHAQTIDGGQSQFKIPVAAQH